MRNILFLILVFGIGCSATNTITMSVQEPAVVEIPSYIEDVGVINRSAPGKDSSFIERVDRVLSIEGLELDKKGAAQSITGLTEELQRIEWFNRVDTISSDRLENPGFGAFPAPLSWDRVSEICQEHQLDALFVLEFYDTETSIDYSAKKVTMSGPLGVEIPALEHHATVETDINSGWRIYDNNSRVVIDEFISTDNFVTTGKGVNPAEAVSAITGRDELVKQISTEIGQRYAGRILPYWVRVRREYYVKGSDNLEAAKRRAQTGNWEGAAELWLEATNSSKSKVAGRASYNMAIFHEIEGELDTAIDWARNSYENYGDKLALRYLRVLERRKQNVFALEQQSR